MVFLICIESVYDIHFVQMPAPPNIVTLFQFDGTSLHLDSDEAKKQIEEMGDGKFYSIPFSFHI